MGMYELKRERVLLSPEIVRHVLHYFGNEREGQDGGHFTNRLFQLIAAADESARDTLSLHWPEHVEAFLVAGTTPWGLDWLRSLAIAEVEGDADALLLLAEATGS